MYKLLDKTKTYYTQGGGYKYVPENKPCGDKELHLSKEFSWVLNEEIHPIIEEKNGILMSVAILEDMAERYSIDMTDKEVSVVLEEINVAIKEEAQAQAEIVSAEERTASALEFIALSSMDDME